MKRVKFRLLALSALMTLVMGAAPALARSSTCETLARQLSRLETAGGVSAASKWDDAAEAQIRSIGAARRDAAYYRCGEAGANARCPALLDKIQRMETNLAKIERQRAKAGKAGKKGAASNRAEILRIRKAMVRNMCPSEGNGRAIREETAHPRLVQQQPRGLLSRVLGPSDTPADTIAPREPERKSVILPVHAGSGMARAEVPQEVESGENGQSLPAYNFPRNATYRTLCVRTCDGYFFPISFSARPGQFGQDAAACEAMCPAAETGLFVYRNPGGDPEDMISLAGVPYTELPNAFRHRKEYVNGCSCQAAPEVPQENAQMAPVAGDSNSRVETVDAERAQANPQTPAIRMSMPPVTIDELPLDVDPDTAQNLREGFDASSLVTASIPAGNETAEQPDSKRPSLPILGSSKPAEPAPAAETAAVPSETGEAQPSAQAAGAEAAEPRGPVRKVGPQFYPDR